MLTLRCVLKWPAAADHFLRRQTGRLCATVRVASSDQTSVAVSVEVRDAVTEKRVSRDVDLTRVPADGRAFAIALAVDELVWASWAEIALAKSQRPAKPPPRSRDG